MSEAPNGLHTDGQAVRRPVQGQAGRRLTCHIPNGRERNQRERAFSRLRQQWATSQQTPKAEPRSQGLQHCLKALG